MILALIAQMCTKPPAKKEFSRAELASMCALARSRSSVRLRRQDDAERGRLD